MLRTQREIIDEFNLNILIFNEQIEDKKVNGRDFFRASKHELHKIFDALENTIDFKLFDITDVDNYQENAHPINTPEDDDTYKKMNKNFEKRNSESDEEIINRKKEIENEYMSFADFLKSSLDTPEFVLMFYNSFNYPKAQRLLIKYKILDTLHIRNLISDEHNVIPEYDLLT